MRWILCVVLLGCYEHHLLDARVAVDARVEVDARVSSDAGVDAPDVSMPDAGPACVREWFDEEIASVGSNPVLHMHAGGDAEVLFSGIDGLQRVRRVDGVWTRESIGIALRLYAFDRDASAIFGAIVDDMHTTLVRVDLTGALELIGDPRFGGMDDLWTSYTDRGTILTWRQNVAQAAWCWNAPGGWVCEEESYGDAVSGAHILADEAGRRVHAGYIRDISAVEIRWGPERWHVPIADRASVQVRARDHLDVFASTELCGIHHISIASLDGEPVSRIIDVCPAFTYRFAITHGPSLHLFTRDEETAYHFQRIRGEWEGTPIPMLGGSDPRRYAASDASVTDDGWLGWAYVIEERGSASPVRLLSSPPCD